MKNDYDRDEEEEESASSSESSETIQEEGEGDEKQKTETSKSLKTKKKKKKSGENGKNKKALARLKGQRVIARCNLDGYYYAGHILSCSSTEKAVVDFDELDRSIVHSKNVIPISGSIARPFIKEDDAVLVLVKNAITGLHCHVPGLVVMAPRADNSQAKFYRILAYNRRYVSAMRYQLVKISGPKFRSAVDYIIERAKQLGLVAVAPPQIGNGRRQNGVSQSVASSEDAVFAGNLHHGKRKSRIHSAGGSVDVAYDQQQHEEHRKHHHRHNRRPSDSLSNDSQLRENDSDVPAVVSTPSTGARSGGSASSLPPRPSAPVPPSSSSNGSHHLSDKCTQATAIVHFGSDNSNNSNNNNSHNNSNVQQQRQTDRGVSPISFLSPKCDDDNLTPRNIVQDKGIRQQPTSPPPPSLDDDDERGLHRTRRYKSSVVTIPYGDFNNNVNNNNSQPIVDGTFRIGQNVLARFPDDGWYYLCTIEQDIGDGSYIVRDRTDDTEIVWKEDIIEVTEQRPLPFRVGELVIAEHPSFPRSFCPGVIIADEDDVRFQGTGRMCEPGRVFVRFYDGVESKVDRRGCSIITNSKFDEDVLYIVHCERRWVGQTVVVKNPIGTYEVGFVRERIGDGRMYNIELLNKIQHGSSLIKQSSMHMFGRYTKARQLRVGDRVLALFDPEKPEYLPGTVRSIFDPSKHRSGPGSYRNSSQSGSSPALVMSPPSRSSPEERQPLLTVKFINGAIVNGLMLCHSFFLNNEYYTEAEHAYKQSIMASGDYATFAKGALKLGDIAGATAQITNKVLNIQLKQPIVVKQEDELTETTATTVTTTTANTVTTSNPEDETTEIASDDGEDGDDFDENEETAEEEEEDYEDDK